MKCLERWGGRLHWAGVLARGGATVGSIVCFPFRRRFAHRRCEIRLRSGVVFLSPPDEPLLYLFEEVWVNRCYAPASFSTASGQTIVDIGAHIGVFTVWAATSYPTARVIAVEPTSDLCAYLRRNVEYNQLGNVDVVEAAVGGFRGEAILWQRGSGMMNSLYTGDNYGSPFRQLQRTPRLLLEDIFERFQVQSCALLKLDCEGSEYEIFSPPRNVS